MMKSADIEMEERESDDECELIIWGHKKTKMDEDSNEITLKTFSEVSEKVIFELQNLTKESIDSKHF